MQKLRYYNAAESDFDKIYEIMDFSFPNNEMRTKEEQHKLFFTNKYYNTICVGDENGLLGFIVVWDLENFIFLENFATAQNMRGRGIGGKLLEYIIETYYEKQDKDIILEVELPVNDISCRRIEFYKRHNFIINDFEYAMPPIRNGNEFLPLKIMSYNKAFTHESFEPYKSLMYQIVYNQNK